MLLCRSRFGCFSKCLIRNFLRKPYNQLSNPTSFRQSSPLLSIVNNNIINNNYVMASSHTATPPKHTNRLAQEKSPYLLQHAHNPVDWYPWSEEAIQRARDENKLIFLSVGYSTCHWCHVMEKESFENEAVANIMNENFVNIKIDREERPDLDKLYMTFILLINGSGGWPMSVWLTPNLEPVTGGTYFPPTDRWGMPGFSTILQKVALKWRTNPEDFKKSGASIIAAIQKNVSEREEEAGAVPTVEAKFKQAVNIFKRNYDKVWGGSAGAPKFPEVSKLNLMLHAHVHKPDVDLLAVLTTTLDKMDNGGIHDHVFGGFARYSVDKKWHVPHFEKMLYDQGQLLRIYSNTYKVTRRERYLSVADKIFQYLVTDLRHPGGGFYSGEDADSLPTAESEEKIEGAFYAWTHEEIEHLVNDNLDQYGEVTTHPFKVYAHHYDVREDGNVEASSDPHGHLTGKNILFVKGSVSATAEKFSMTVEDVVKVLRTTNRLLHAVRNKRPRPHLDTKIICAWNGLVLTGLAKLASINDTPNRQQYLDAAKKQVEFLRQNLYDPVTKKLYRSCYGESDTEEAGMLAKPIHGFLDDYAFLIKGLIDYYVTTLDIDAITWAKELQDTQNRLFWDDQHSGYFYSEANAPNVVVRLKEDHDGAEPCGNSIAAHNLFLLHGYFEDADYLEKVQKLFAFFAGVQPFGWVLPEMLSAQIVEDFGLNMLAVIGPDGEATTKLFDTMRNFHIPGFIALHMRPGEEEDSPLRQSALQLKMMKSMPTAYICHNKICHMPVTDPNKLRTEMRERYVLDCDKCSNSK